MIENPVVLKNGYGIKDAQEVEESLVECMACKDTFNVGELVIQHEDGFFCDTGCLASHLLDVADYEEVEIIKTGRVK